MLAVYISASQFRTGGDLTAEFIAGRRIKADCGVDGIKYSTVQSSSYSNPNTTVTITESVLTSNLTDVLYGIINIGAEGSLPNHSHSASEGQGSQINFVNLTNKSLLTMEDTPSAYNNGKFLKSTTNGFVLDDTPNQTVFSGTEMFVDGDATVTGTVYAHVYDSYSPLTIRDGGVDVIVGNGAGKVDFPNGITVSGSVAVGPRGFRGITGAPGTAWLNGSGVPAGTFGSVFDYYLDDDTGDTYRKDDGTFSANLFTNTAACSADLNPDAAGNVLIGGEMWNVYDPAYPPSWQYDFGDDFDQIIVRISLTQGWSSYNFGSGYILGSNDGVNYDILHYFSPGRVPSQTDTYDFVNKTIYRFIKIQMTGGGSSGIAVLAAYAHTAVAWQLTGNIKGADGATASGTTSSGGATTFLELTDTPAAYADGLFAQSTASGIVWATVSGISGTTTPIGNWILVDTIEFNNEAKSVSIPCQGDTYSKVRLEATFTSAPTAYDDLILRLNGDTDANYGYAFIVQNGTSTSSNGAGGVTSLLYALGSATSTREINTEVTLNLKSGRKRTSYTREVLYTSDDLDRILGHYAGYWTNTVDEVTSIDIQATEVCTGTIKVYRWQDITEPMISYDPTGKQSIKVEYKSDNEVYINPGIVEINGTEYKNSTRTTISGSYDPDVWYYINATVSGSTLSFTTSSGVPELDYNKMGYYTGNDRCIGFFVANSLGGITPFTVHSKTYSFDGHVVIDDAWADVTSATGLTVTMVVPFGTMYCETHLFGRATTATDYYAYARNPDKPTTSRMVGWSGDSGIYYSNTTFVECSEAKEVYFWPDAGTMKIRILQNSFEIPEYIYTGA